MCNAGSGVDGIKWPECSCMESVPLSGRVKRASLVLRYSCKEVIVYSFECTCTSADCSTHSNSSSLKCSYGKSTILEIKAFSQSNLPTAYSLGLEYTKNCILYEAICDRIVGILT